MCHSDGKLVREGNLSIQKCSQQLDKTLVYRLNSFHGSELRIHIDIDNCKISEVKSESNVGKVTKRNIHGYHMEQIDST